MPAPRLFSRILLLAALSVHPALAQDPAAASPASPASPVAAAAVAPREAMVRALLEVERDPLFKDARVSAQVVDVESGEEVWSVGADAALVPASVMKVITTHVALRELGPAFRVGTAVLAEGELRPDGVLDGNLYLRGQGDPSLVIERAWRMVLDLKLRGLREVSGDLVFDDTYFESGASLIPGWNNPDDIANPPAYFPMLGALSVNFNTVEVAVRAGAAAGAPTTVELGAPTKAVVIDNASATGPASGKPSLRLQRTVDEKTKVLTIRIEGSLPERAPAEVFYRPVADPTTHAWSTFQGLLAQNGIVVKGRTRPGGTPAAARVVVQDSSPPLVELTAQVNKHSNNFYAEQLLRILGAEKRGRPGTTAKGLDVVSGYLTSLGFTANDFTLVNGSGLSRDIRLRPSVVNAVLIQAARDPVSGPEFVASLSAAGRDGTLRRRYRDDGMKGRVRGKTGTLAGVSSLAGYVRSVDGRLYAFTVFANGTANATARTRTVQDAVVLAVSGTRLDLATLGADAAEDTP
jgi:D-alanyl-D-alanine carboxypeptidase/D-alanyl-D-alanine-endopeptidase (penicillin-binding protein 4)